MATSAKVKQAAQDAHPEFHPEHKGHDRLTRDILAADVPPVPTEIGREALHVLVLLEHENYRLGHFQQDAVRDVLRKARAAGVIAPRAEHPVLAKAVR